MVIAHRRRGMVLAIVGSLLIVGCNSRGGDTHRPPQLREGRAITVGNKVTADTRVMRLGRVAIFSQSYRVVEPLVLKSFRPISLADGLDLLASRISFISRSKTVRDKPAVNGYPGIMCSDAWPLASFGPTYEPTDQALDVGDYFAVIYYVRIVRAGDWDLRGTIFSYVKNGDSYEQVADNTEFIGRGAASGVLCGKRESIWLGTDKTSP